MIHYIDLLNEHKFISQLYIFFNRVFYKTGITYFFSQTSSWLFPRTNLILLN